MNMWVGAWRKGGGGRVISDCSKKTKQKKEGEGRETEKRVVYCGARGAKTQTK